MDVYNLHPDGEHHMSDDKQMRGMGDLVERITEKTGIKAVVDKVAEKTGKDCGCGKRRDKLNKAIPFGGKS